MENPELIASKFKIRASAALDICTGTVGLTDVQFARMAELTLREQGTGKPLTADMVDELAKLKMKHAFPELPDGAKTYCKKWLKEYLYKRRPDIKSKYIDKGNAQEEDGFTVMCLELNLGMVYKNTTFHEDEYMCGTDDVFTGGKVYDNKCSWSLDTFPMFETELPDAKYEWQVNVYANLRKVSDGVVAYTLVDAPLDIVERELRWIDDQNKKYKKAMELIFTEAQFKEAQAMYFPDATDTYFIEIPQEKRIKPFGVTKDEAKINLIIERVKMCRAYILTLLK